jgi:hypothetical protein
MRAALGMDFFVRNLLGRMITKRVNPYDAPRIVDAAGLRHANAGPPHLSNRVMAWVFALPATLFLVVGCTCWADLILNVSVPAGKKTSVMAAVAIGGFVLPALGLAMMGIAVFLWRYRDRDGGQD